MAITAKDRQQLNQLYADYSPRYRGRKENYFALYYLSRKFKQEPEEIAHQVAFDDNDVGIDAYYIDRAAGNLYLFQFSWTENHAYLKKGMERLVANGIPQVFGGGAAAQSSSLLGHLAADLKEVRKAIERVYIHLVFKGDLEAAESSEGLGHRKEAIEDKHHLIQQYFQRDIELRVDFISDKPGIPPSAPLQSYTVRIADVIEVPHDGHRMLIGFVPLIDLHEIHMSLRQRFFDRNIRAALSVDKAPNKRIRSALADIVLQGKEQPSVFAFRHNGVTIAAERIEEKDGSLLLHVPRLLNGAQTVSSLGIFLDDNADNAALARGKDRLDDIRVLAKIVEGDPSSAFVVDVTIANNQQNPVPPWALRAMDRRQVDLADKFRDELGIFYSRQEGAFENLSEEEKADLGIEESKDIRIRPLAQTFLAAQGELDRMSRLPDVFESKTLYEATFRESYALPGTDVRNILLAYKIGLVLNSPMDKLKSLAPAKHAIAVKRARNLTWALLIQALLNDPKLEQLQADFGTTLSKELLFRERLQTYASSRIYPLLREILAVPTYEERLVAQRYEFLRTKEVYKRCMEFAQDRFEWKKINL
jgi:hypothetical protein